MAQCHTETDHFMVNSLHGQGIKTLGQGLSALAHAEDGLVEAAHCPAFKQFTLGVQWHPEWLAHENPLSIKLFQAFGDAARDFSQHKYVLMLIQTYFGRFFGNQQHDSTT